MALGIPNRIDNRKGQKIATMTEWGSSIELKDASDRLIGKYIKQVDRTYDRNNCEIGKGNLLQRLIPC